MKKIDLRGVCTEDRTQVLLLLEMQNKKSKKKRKHLTKPTDRVIM